MIRNRVGSLWRTGAAGLKSAFARGTVECPRCGATCRVLAFEVQTRRSERSPDLVIYEVGPSVAQGEQSQGRTGPEPCGQTIGAHAGEEAAR